MGREQGTSDAKLRALPAYQHSPLYSAAEKAALAYADSMTQRHTVSQETFQALRDCYSDDAIVELTAAIAWEIGASTFNRALQIEAQGVCLLTTPEA